MSRIRPVGQGTETNKCTAIRAVQCNVSHWRYIGLRSTLWWSFVRVQPIFLESLPARPSTPFDAPHTALHVENHSQVISCYLSYPPQDIGWFDEHPPGELPSTVTSAMAKIQDGIGRKVGGAIFLFFDTPPSWLIWLPAFQRVWRARANFWDAKITLVFCAHCASRSVPWQNNHVKWVWREWSVISLVLFVHTRAPEYESCVGREEVTLISTTPVIRQRQTLSVSIFRFVSRDEPVSHSSVTSQDCSRPHLRGPFTTFHNFFFFNLNRCRTPSQTLSRSLGPS